MKKRSPFAVVGLSTITLGIYYLYWLFSTKNALNQKTHIKIPSIWLLIAPSVVTLGGYLAVIIGTGINTTSSSASPSSLAGPFVFGLIFVFVGGIATFALTLYWFWKYSKAAEAYTNKELSSVVAFLLLWLLSSFGISAALIQDKYNDVDEDSQSNNAFPQQPYGPPQPPQTNGLPMDQNTVPSPVSNNQPQMVNQAVPTQPQNTISPDQGGNDFQPPQPPQPGPAVSLAANPLVAPNPVTPDQPVPQPMPDPTLASPPLNDNQNPPAPTPPMVNQP